MSAYVVIIRKQTTDPAGMVRYNELARLAPVGNMEMLAAKTCKFQVVEGSPVEAVVVLRFPSMHEALAWYHSPEYQRAVPHRHASADVNMYVVDGVN